MQVRPLLFVVYVNCVFVAYWIYEQAFTSSYGDLSSWFICVALGGGQNYCAETITHLPGYTITAVRFLLLFPFTSFAHSLRSPITAGPHREHWAVPLFSLRD